MSDFVHTRRVIVSLWNRRVGTIIPAKTSGYYAFKFDDDFVKSGLEISPLMMKLSSVPYEFKELPINEYHGLPPVFADSLPDSFGASMIDRWLMSRGVAISEATVLDRLSYLGRRGMGALTYEPEHGPCGKPTAIDLRKLVEDARRVMNGELADMEGVEALRAIIRIGSSAGGAQAKAVVGWNRKTNEFLLGDRDLPVDFEHWIIKFTPREFPWRGEKEYELYLKAKSAGVRMAESVLLELDGLKHFMTKRFDRGPAGMRYHLLSLSAMAHFPMSVPMEFRTYEQLLMTVEKLNLGYDAKAEAFRRIAFNIAVGECDDHTKNFSFRMSSDGRWELSPAYDLTGSNFPSTDPWSAHGGRHMLSVNGKFGSISDSDLLTMADRFAIGTAEKILNQIKEPVK